MAAAAVTPAAAAEEYRRATVRLQAEAVDSAVAADSAVVVTEVDLPRLTEHPVEVAVVDTPVAAAAGHRPPATEHPRLRVMGHRLAVAAAAVSEVVASAAERLPAAMEHHRLPVMEPHLARPAATGHHP